ncbi:valine--tRNA ligase [Thermomicrobium sp. 4228-Ro]|uniref:valine--tRNA ligase n=1 Tax=Thermomicrobium sp. 4228-Ro TaxID=2993937 RepID=UPI00224985FB|nr:valine--tRNA ligase [Thermomicrobium sp. 4228-Ro]MCX2726714.1 valine--tRNA ligase [Thermomicrobium sp. 4228-Ro]
MTQVAHSDELAPAYQPRAVESRWYDWWEQQGYFTPTIDWSRKPFVIIMPPPNVTGELHMGHALFVAIEDLMIRWRRMQGYPTLWLPGADHAGIAGQWVVERELLKEGLTRHDLGREKFLERVWDWMNRYRGRIREQLRILGASCDWTRFRFTMDPGPSRAVRTAFKRLYDKGLIYRGERLINWCPRCMTALSDLEVDHEELEGTLYFLRYPVEGSDESVVVATTRPETMLGDTGVAVHPEDERYRHLIGKTAILPLLGRRLRIVADEAVDPAFGTGAVKVTPAHDFTDFEIAQRHDLPPVNILNPDGTLNENAGPFAGLTIQEARRRVVEELDRQGYLVRTEPHRYSLGHCQRCGTVVEPMISKQWFVKMAPLAQPAIEVARNGTLQFIPERFRAVYLHWLENVRDWCISRQLWWGHRIPVWYCQDCGRLTVTAEETVERCEHCGSTRIEQDPDVLDTWFSSGLWPFSTLGWPDDTEDLRYFYPGSVMETGYDILFFWVARMVFLGLEFMGEVPFYTVYLHGTVRDERGQRMSKTKGNVIDPTEVTQQYGADALRFTLVTMAGPGTDMKLSLNRVEASRNFANKIWNATRYTLRALAGGEVERTPDGSVLPPRRESVSLADRWILSRLQRVTESVTDLMERYQFHEAGHALYEFLWSEFCDWYIEASKVAINAGGDRAQAARQTLAYVLERALRLLHPFMPFVTEELWQRLPHAGESIMVAPWPEPDTALVDEEAEREFAFLMEAIRAVRNARAEAGVEPARWVQAIVFPGSHRQTFLDSEGIFRFLARVASDGLTYVDELLEAPKQVVSLIVDDAVIYLPLRGMLDIDAERQRLQRELEALLAELDRTRALLANEQFVSRAPTQVVERQRTKLADIEERVQLIQQRLEELG